MTGNEKILFFRDRRWALGSVVTIVSLCASVAWLLAGQDTWTTEGGAWNDLEITMDSKGLKVDEYVPAGATVKLFPTNNGEKIKNADNSVPWLEYTNTGGAGFTQEFIWAFQKINGKNVTDVEQETTYNPTGVLQAAAFSGSAMTILSSWLFSEGYSGSTKLAVPDFDKGSGVLYAAVRLEAWEAQGVALSPAAVGSTYSVVGGSITSRLSGSGPTAAQLASYVVSTDPCTPAGGGGWTAASPYTGTATLFGYHEFGSFDASNTGRSPSLTMWGVIVFTLLILGTGFWMLRARRQRTA